MIQTKNFSQAELERSSKATKYGIDNRIPNEYIKNAYELLCGLQTIRDALGKPINITSGYRCERLNNIVGGVRNSSHLKGWAADIQVDGMGAKALYNWLSGFLVGSKMKFGQLLYEQKGTTSWVHFSIRDEGRQRCQIKEIYV